MIRLFASCIFILSSCGVGQKTSSNQLLQETIAFKTLHEDFFGGYTDSKFIVITDKKSLTQVYNLINKGKFPEIKTPEINFDKEMVVALFLGEKNSGGYAISVEKIFNTSNKTYVVYKETSPKPGEMVTTVMTQPFTIAKIPKTSKEIVFKKLD